jgi:ubiquinone/menaquinone biosynthesis C-methylase UbiE
MSYGWLPPITSKGTSIEGILLDVEGTKTRYEEYTWVKELVPYKSYVLDAAAGYVPGWHILPEVLSVMGHKVVAVDINPETLTMPADQSIVRKVMDITDLQFHDRTFDVVTCVSTLEHMSEEARKLFITEAARVLKPSGTLLVTADNYPGMTPGYLKELCDDAFKCGDPDLGELKSFAGGKRVAYLHAFRK